MADMNLHADTAKPTRPAVVAVAGNPNCGKTTLFNALTGLRQQVGNYPGVTVEKREGQLSGEPNIRLIDLPGTYSLSARSPDEEVAREVLLGHVANTPRPDAVLIVLDATNLTRNLYLATQIIELGLPTVIACNMMDQLESVGHILDVERLATAIGVPIVPTIAHRAEGTDAIREALLAALQEDTSAPRGKRGWPLPTAIDREVGPLAETLAETGFASPAAAEGTAILLIGEEASGEDQTLPPPVRDALDATLARLGDHPEADPSLEITCARYNWLAEVVKSSLRHTQLAREPLSDRLDRVLTHRFIGLVIFAGLMIGLFYSIFFAADPLIGLAGLKYYSGRPASCHSGGAKPNVRGLLR